MRIKKFFPLIAFALIFVSFPQTGFSGTCKIGDSDLRNWETSIGFLFSGSRGNTDKTDVGANFCYEFEKAENRVINRTNYQFGKVDGVTNEELWNFTLDYLRRIYANESEGRSLFFSLGSFAQRDEINSISLRYGFGGGFDAEFPLPSLVKAQSGIGIFWEREDGVSTAAENFASLRFSGRLEKETENFKTSLSSVFTLPLNETDNFRNESEISLEVPVFAEIFSLKLTAGLDFDNQPIDASVKKTDFRYTTSLNFSF